MYKIAICDDEILTCSELENFLLEYANSNHLNFDIDIFYSGEKLLDYLKNDEIYDLLFLDIELITLNGIEIGKFIRDSLHNENLILVYISSKEHYAMQLFKTRPFDFLIKPINFKSLNIMLKKALNIISAGNEFFEYKIGQTLYRIKYCDIIYFRSLKRKIIISSTHGDFEFYGHLAEIIPKLPPYRFIQIHKSYVIQYDYVAEYNYEWIKTTNNEIINISKPFRKDVRNTILNR